MKTLQMYEYAWEENDTYGKESIRIYFRIPFTEYHVGREIGKKLVLFRYGKVDTPGKNMWIRI